MTNDIEGVNVHVVYSGNERVMIGNGQSPSISHIGSVSTFVPNSSLLLSNVLVVPGITISQLTKDNNYCVIFFLFWFYHTGPSHKSSVGGRQM